MKQLWEIKGIRVAFPTVTPYGCNARFIWNPITPDPAHCSGTSPTGIFPDLMQTIEGGPNVEKYILLVSIPLHQE